LENYSADLELVILVFLVFVCVLLTHLVVCLCVRPCTFVVCPYWHVCLFESAGNGAEILLRFFIALHALAAVSV